MEGVLQVGDPRLRRICEPVADPTNADFRLECSRLQDMLVAFRRQHGFGRAIAAPQIGINKRLIAMNLGQGPFSVINPEIVWRSEETITLWDDCMSFPWLLVRVCRNKSISVRFQNERGEHQEWSELEVEQSELFQHEIDHLDGVLALDLMLDREAVISREVFQNDSEHFKSLVTYAAD